jgi:hypothetical protein
VICCLLLDKVVAHSLVHIAAPQCRPDTCVLLRAAPCDGQRF